MLHIEDDKSPQYPIIISIIKKQPYALKGPNTSNMTTAGRSLVEFLGLRIDLPNKPTGKMFGTVKAIQNSQESYLYNREAADSEPIASGYPNALLTGPSRALSADADFCIYFDLRDGENGHEISKGSTVNRHVYDGFLADTVDGQYGRSTLTYILMRNAAEALIEVFLVDVGGEEKATEMHGTIAAAFSTYPAFKIELFRKAPGEAINAKPGEPIPLLRSALALPVDETLTISAYLGSQDSPSTNDDVAAGDAEFVAGDGDAASRSISGKNGRIDVRVRWM